MSLQLNKTQHRILGGLARKAKTCKTAGDLAEATELTREGVYGALEPLCQAGLVDGVEDDSTKTGKRGRPAVHLSITSKGRALFESTDVATLPDRRGSAVKAKAPAKAKAKAPAKVKAEAPAKAKAKVKPKAPAKAKVPAKAKAA